MSCECGRCWYCNSQDVLHVPTNLFQSPHVPIHKPQHFVGEISWNILAWQRSYGLIKLGEAQILEVYVGRRQSVEPCRNPHPNHAGRLDGAGRHCTGVHTRADKTPEDDRAGGTRFEEAVSFTTQKAIAEPGHCWSL